MKEKGDFIRRALKFSVDVIKLTELFPNKRQFWIIADQLIRSACSIGANMKEANSASGKKDYINFYSHALKSANETIYWLDLLSELWDNSIINKLISEANELARILAASIITMKKSQTR
mgnify:CR=1 FL=1